MTSEEALLAVIDALETAGVPYMVVGSFSSNYYSFARGTKDADIVVELKGLPLSTICKQLGPEFQLDPQMRFETVTGTVCSVLRAPDPDFIIELFRLSGDAHDQERFQRRRRVRLYGRETWLPTVEDVIVQKLRWILHGGRPKDREDVRNVLAVQGAQVDWHYVHRWCDEHGTRELLDEIRRSIPPI